MRARFTTPSGFFPGRPAPLMDQLHLSACGRSSPRVRWRNGCRSCAWTRRHPEASWSPYASAAYWLPVSKWCSSPGAVAAPVRPSSAPQASARPACGRASPRRAFFARRRYAPASPHSRRSRRSGERAPDRPALGALHAGQVIPDRQRQRLEYRKWRPGGLPLRRRIKARLEKRRSRTSIDQAGEIIERR